MVFWAGHGPAPPFYNGKGGATLSKPLLALILAAAPLGAEFLHVEQAVTGLDCVSCAESAPRNLKKIKGVASASFRTADAVAVLEMKPDNTVPLGDIRDAVKRMGYTPTSAKITAKGQARLEAGKWIFRVAGIDADYPLDITAGQGIEAQLRQGSALIVEGSIADPASPIKVSTVRPAE
jgi:copper chaperone CopZ